jgi:phospholipase C
LAQAAQSICVGSYGVPDIEWITQHSAWDNGRLDAFLTTEARGDATLEQAPVVMGYLTRAELPFYFSLADAFTLCDSYHCSVLGPTMPNRLYSISGTIDPQGRHGGPVVDTPAPAEGSAAFGSCDWITMPEVLEDHGISWKVYEEAGTASGSALRGAPATSFNALSFFKQHVRDPNSALYQRAFLPTWPAEFNADVQSGQLPTVSWVLPPLTYSEHPSTDPLAGQWFISQVLSALMTNRQLWSRTVVFLTYDENGGFFDHVSPPTSPAGTADEMVTTKARTGQAGDFDQPIGLGFRVPTLVVSPWSRGGWINSETFDHTSMLRFLEARFDVRAPNISAWRRETVGDLTSTLSFRAADDSPVSLPSTSFEFAQGCPTPQNLGPFFGPPEAVSVPNAPQLPTQEPGTARRRPT